VSGEPPPLARDSRGTPPDFFIVGHPKCGTTALYEMLRAHPQIYMPDLKETQFFARERQRASASQRHPQTLAEYLELFHDARPGQRTGEASTSYLRSYTAAGRIAELRPDGRIIGLFREPADFLRSLHLQLLQAGIETEPDFAKAIALEPGRRERERGSAARDSLWSQALLYSQNVRYVEQLRRYHEHFGRARVLALIYDDFRADNEAVARQVLRFLDVDDSLPIERSEANPTVRVRARAVDEVVRSVSVGGGPLSRALKRSVKTVTTRRVRRMALHAVGRVVIDSEPPAPDPELLQELRRRFKDEVVAASEYLQRDLVGLWGYDKL
jgi:hypothetical protein